MTVQSKPPKSFQIMKDIKVCPDLVSCTVTSPIGPIVFEVCPLGLMKLKLSPEVTNENFLELASEDIEVIDDKENRKSKCSDPVGPKVLTWLHNYFVLGRNIELKLLPFNFSPKPSLKIGSVNKAFLF